MVNTGGGTVTAVLVVVEATVGVVLGVDADGAAGVTVVAELAGVAGMAEVVLPLPLEPGDGVVGCAGVAGTAGVADGAGVAIAVGVADGKVTSCSFRISGEDFTGCCDAGREIFNCFKIANNATIVGSDGADNFCSSAAVASN